MSLETIHALSQSAAKQAAQENLEPYVPWDREEVMGYLDRGFPFPNLGDYRPHGWKLVETLFCDSSGFGREDEPALTARQLRARLADLIEEGRGYGYAVIEVGQFQVKIGVFEKEES